MRSTQIFNRKAKTAPSHYPRLPFHGLRSAQLLASLVVGAVMCYYIYNLRREDYAVPWTFIWLTSASFFSILALIFTIVLHCCIGLNPRLNLALNGFLLILWTLSWSLLTWFMSPTLANACDVEHWTEDMGIMVCRIYKALFTFTLIGFLSTLAAFILDIYVHRNQTRRGVYRLHDMENKRQLVGAAAPFSRDSRLPRESSEWEEPRPSMGPYGDNVPDAARPLYTMPEGQFQYETGYHGGGGDAAGAGKF
ncbi:unnamed protein product [Zymoseptoria tritici ST99CH_3D7]|uniref:MARVEL domain-containing protein n=1 Tax=Zymoseptoria tritici (strain ST99CH_3D7) TaxID=1276538 RepID=A0A1X7RQJ5_ZYMT9|nr:unnamed protein product [Zymoseptoria tritici ST99CH_3D7]